MRSHFILFSGNCLLLLHPLRYLCEKWITMATSKHLYTFTRTDCEQRMLRGKAANWVATTHSYQPSHCCALARAMLSTGLWLSNVSL